MSTSNALHSLYGGKSARLGAEATPVRRQEIHTPTWILDAVRDAFGGAIALDPCAASDPAHWFAERNVSLPAGAQTLVDELDAATTKEEKKRLKAALKPFYLHLPAELDDRTFINSPFEFLEPWMRLAYEQSQVIAYQGGHPRPLRIVQLVPVRTRRMWWPKFARGAQVVCLAAFPFVGSLNAFPGDIALLARNCVIPPLGKRETGRFVL